MNKEYNMFQDENDVTLSLSKRSISLDGEKLKVNTVSIGKFRRKSTFSIIMYLMAVIAVGVIIYASFSTLVSGDDISRPYQDLSYSTTVPIFEDGMETSQYISAKDEGGVYHNLGGSNIDFVKEGMDTITVNNDIPGQVLLRISFFGSADDIFSREISQLRITIDTEVNYTLFAMRFISTDDNDRIVQQWNIGSTLINGETLTGKNTYDVEVEEEDILVAKKFQRNTTSASRGFVITISFPDGMPRGEYDLNAEWAPEYRHEMTTIGLLIAVGSLSITLVALLVVYNKVSRSEPCLVLDTEGGEYTFTGKDEDISELYMGISKITIPKMTDSLERRTERPGITKGNDLMDEDVARQIGKELKNRPGGSGKMIVHQCPECLGTELYYETGFMTGYKYHCKNCDYVGPLVIEKQVNFDQ